MTTDFCGPQEWVHTCEAAATDIIRHVYEFVRNATLRSPLVRDTIVWLVDHLAAFGGTLDFRLLCEGLSGSEYEALWTDAGKAVMQHKYSDTRCGLRRRRIPLDNMSR